MKKWILYLVLIYSVFLSSEAPAQRSLGQEIAKELNKRYPKTQIELEHKQGLDKDLGDRKLQILEEDLKGRLHFQVFDQNKKSTHDDWIAFSAWAYVPLATRKIRPGEILSSSDFSVERLDIAQAAIRDLRSILYFMDANKKDFDESLEATQTILEGSRLSTISLRLAPQVRRGEFLKVELISNQVVLKTIGKAEENGYFNKNIRILIGKNKKEISGILNKDRTVEVHL